MPPITKLNTILPAHPGARSVRGYCEWSGLGRTYVCNAIKSGALPSLKIGRRRLITHDDGVAFLERHRVAMPKAA